MAVVFPDLQEHTAQAGVAGQTWFLNAYDDVTGLPCVVTGASLGAMHPDFVGNITISVVANKAQLTLDASGLTGSLTPRWFVPTITVGGVNHTLSSGSNVYVLTYVTDTITAPTTLTQDYPTSASVTHVHITGSGTVTGAGHKISFPSGTELYGGITVDDGITLSGMGDASNPAISCVCKGSARITLGAATFDACGQALSYQANIYGDSGVTCGPITINANSLVPVTSAHGTSIENILHKGSGNPITPSTYDKNMVVRRSMMRLDGGASFLTISGKFSGLRGGISVENIGIKFLTLSDLYVNCQQSLLTWADVQNLSLSDAQFTIVGPILLRGGEWCIRVTGGGTFDQNVIVSECTSHSYLDLAGTSSADTIVQQVIFLPGNTDVGTANMIGHIRVRGPRVKIRRTTHIGVVGDTWTAGAITIDDGQVAPEVTSCLFYKLQIDRGPTPVGDGCINPDDGSENWQTTSGSPLRPATNPNRMDLCDYNLDYQCVSVGSDTYQKYLIGTTTGSPGTHDPASVDPQFIGGGTYTWNETKILNGQTSVRQVWNDIRQAYRPQNSALKRGGYGGVDIGAVDFAPYLLVKN